MLQRTITIVAYIVAAFAIPSFMLAQSPPTENSLEPLAWLVGGSWVAETKTPDGNSRSIETRYEWSNLRKAIKSSTVYKTNDQPGLPLEGTYFWHPGKKQILMLQAGSSVTESVVQPSDGKLLHDNTLTRANGTTDRQRAEFTRDGDDIYLLKASVLNNTEWKEVVTLTFKRRGSAAAAAGKPAKPAATAAVDSAKPAASRTTAEGDPAARNATTAARPNLEDLAWLAGSWVEKKPGVETEENWITPKGGMLLGTNRTVRESGRTSFEFLRIARTATGISYFAQPSGRPPTEFKLVQAVEQKVTFENPGHDFPQRIIYWLDRDGALHARIEGQINGQTLSQEWTWQSAAKK